MNILIIDDDRKFAQKLKNDLFMTLSGFCDNTCYEVITENFLNMSLNKNYEFVFLDIDLIDENGISLAKRIIDESICKNIVFVSSYDQLVYESLVVHPYFFIRKNHYHLDLNIFFDLIKDSLIHHDFITLKFLGQKQVIDLDKVMYAYIEMGILTIESIDKKYNDNRLLKEFLSICDSLSFVQISKSAIINLDYLDHFSSYEVTMKDNVKLKIGRAYKASFKQRYQEYLLS